MSDFFSLTQRAIIGSTSGSSAFTGDWPRLSSGIFQKERGLGRWQPMTNLDGFGRTWADFLSTVSAMMAAMTAPTKPTPITTTISWPSARAALTSASTRAISAA